MNFLPPSLQRKRLQQQMLIKLAAIQAVIFFAIILLVLVFHMSKSHAENRLAILNTQLENEIFTESQATVNRIQLYIERDNLQAEIPELMELPFFDAQTLSEKLDGVPNQARLQSMDITEQDARFVVSAPQMRYIDDHLANWRPLVGRVGLESAAMRDGRVVYVIVTGGERSQAE